MMWLCKIGFHSFKDLPLWGGVLNPMPVEICKRCGIGRQFHIMGAEFRYTKEQMDALLKEKGLQ